MTATNTSAATSTGTNFDTAARVYRVRRELSSGVNAKSDLQKYASDTDLLWQCLTFLVSFGYLNPEQATALWNLLTGSEGFVDLPPVPFPEGRFGSGLYDTFRAALALEAASAGPVDGVGTAIQHIGQVIVDIGVKVEQLEQQMGGWLPEVLSQ